MSNQSPSAGDAAPVDDDRPDDPAGTDGGARADGHLDEVPDGAGCTEIWERLSDARADD